MPPRGPPPRHWSGSPPAGRCATAATAWRLAPAASASSRWERPRARRATQPPVPATRSFEQREAPDRSMGEAEPRAALATNPGRVARVLETVLQRGPEAPVPCTSGTWSATTRRVSACSDSPSRPSRRWCRRVGAPVPIGPPLPDRSSRPPRRPEEPRRRRGRRREGHQARTRDRGRSGGPLTSGRSSFALPASRPVSCQARGHERHLEHAS
jgi:hypothetical protein